MKPQSVRIELKVSKEMEAKITVDDIKSEVTWMVFDEFSKTLYLATKRGHVFMFQ